MNSYFLGANSRYGFFSLYGAFPPEPGAFLHILKGGPGTGKSTLLRRLAVAAESLGLEVQRVLCSGDPDSLDGIYIPTLARAWADGTAPHVLEPGLFGVNGDYLELGHFMTQPLSSGEKTRLLSLQAENRLRYRAAYQALADSAAAGWRSVEPQAIARDALDDLPACDKKPLLRRCFFSAISCKGPLRLPVPEDTRILTVSPAELGSAAELAACRGWDAVACPWPLDPREQEALLLPEAKLAFLALRSPSPEAEAQLNRAIDQLRLAKELHDEMEAIYRHHMDFYGLNTEAERQIDAAFSK